MDQMAKGLLFGAAVLSQAAAGCFPAAAASIDRVRIRLAAEELDEMGMPVLEAESRDRAYSVTGVERISGDPASGPAMDGAEVGKKEKNDRGIRSLNGSGLDAEEKIKYMEDPGADQHDAPDHDLIHHDEGCAHHERGDAHHGHLLTDAQPFSVEEGRHVLLIQRSGVQPVMKPARAFRKAPCRKQVKRHSGQYRQHGADGSQRKGDDAA